MKAVHLAPPFDDGTIVSVDEAVEAADDVGVEFSEEQGFRDFILPACNRVPSRY